MADVIMDSAPTITSDNAYNVEDDAAASSAHQNSASAESMNAAETDYQPPEAAVAATDPALPVEAAPVDVANAPDADPPVDAPGADVDTESEALRSYWSAVNKTPTDFTAWTYLLQFVEQEDNMKDVRKAFDEFLKLYPYCYGYWKKYADIESKHGKIKEAYEVFKKGTSAVPLSVDLWLHFVTFAIGVPYPADEIHSLFEQAVAAAGLDFRSDKLWDKYVEWELQRSNLKGATKIFMRLLTIPTQLYNHHYDSFKRHMEGHSVIEVLEEREIEKWREIVKAGTEGHGRDAPPGLEGSHDSDGTHRSELSLLELLDPVEAVAVKSRVIEKYGEMYRKNEEEVSKRWTYEEGIRRPYFHVKALEKGQLKNWHDYLDFEMGCNSHDRTVVLFERCLIACALYEEFWLKYANYLEATDPAATRKVYSRACEIHLRKKASLHLAWAFFEERQGDAATARRIVDQIEATQPQSLSILIHKLNLYRRSGIDIDDLYRNYVEQATSLEVGSFLAIKWARYLSKVRQSPEQARTVLTERIAKNPGNEQLYLQLLDLELQQLPLDESRILSVFDQVEANSAMSVEHKHMFVNRKYEFLEDFGTSISKLYEVYLAANAVNSSVDSSDGKRKHESASEDENEHKKPKAEFVNGSDGHDYSGAAAAAAAANASGAQQYPTMADPNAAYYNQWQGYGGYYQGGYQQQWPGYSYGY